MKSLSQVPDYREFRNSMENEIGSPLLNDGKESEHQIGSSLCLIGGFHSGAPSRAVVEDILDERRPDVVAIESCEERAFGQESSATEVSEPVQQLLNDDYSEEGERFFDMIQHIFGVRTPNGEITYDYEYNSFEYAMDYTEQEEVGLALVDRKMSTNVFRYANLVDFPTIQDEFERLQSHFNKPVWSVLDVCRPDGQTRSRSDSVYNDVQSLAPEYYRVMHYERNLYIALSLINLSKNDNVDTIIAIVGLSHLSPLIEHLQNPIAMPQWDFSEEPNPTIWKAEK